MALGTTAMEEPYLTVERRPAGFLRRRRFLWSFLPVWLVALVGGVALVVSGNAFLPFESITTVEGMAASKSEFFHDEQVQRILLAHRLRIHLTVRGSRELANQDFSAQDFVFPSGAPSGNHVLQRLGEQGRSTSIYKPFTSSVVLASYRDSAESLRAAGVATAQHDPDQPDAYYYRLDMPKFFQLISDRKRWNDIGPIPSANRITAFTPNICSANSAASYMALVAFVTNQYDVPQNEEEAEALAIKIKPLVSVFGQASEDLFIQYKTPEGKGTPIVAVYEHQYLSYQVEYRARNGHPDRERVLLYPSVNVRTEPVLIPFTPIGERVGQLLATDPDLRRRATELGFRLVSRDALPTDDPLPRYLRDQGLPAPSLSQADGTAALLPRQDLLEKMIMVTGDCA